MDAAMRFARAVADLNAADAAQSEFGEDHAAAREEAATELRTALRDLLAN